MRAIGLALCVALAGCGGGGDSGPAPVQTAQTPPVAQAPKCTPVAVPVKVVLFGDSTMAPTEVTTVLQAQMDARFGAGNVVVVNRARSGTLVDNLLAGEDGLNPPWPAPLDIEHANVAVVNHAINSMQLQFSQDEYAGKMQTLVDLSKGHVNRLIFETPNPDTTAQPFGAQWKVDALPAYVTTMESVAAKNNLQLIDVNAWMLAQPDWQTTYMSDGLHPNTAFYDVEIPALMGPGVAKAVGELLCQ